VVRNKSATLYKKRRFLAPFLLKLRKTGKICILNGGRSHTFGIALRPVGIENSFALTGSNIGVEFFHFGNIFIWKDF